MLKDRMWILWFYGQAFHESKLEKPVGAILGVLGFQGAEQHWITGVPRTSEQHRCPAVTQRPSHPHALEFKFLHCWPGSSPRKSCFRPWLTAVTNGQITTENCWKNSQAVSAAHLGNYLMFRDQYRSTWLDFPKQLVTWSSYFKGIHHWWLLSSFGRSVSWMLLPNEAGRNY